MVRLVILSRDVSYLRGNDGVEKLLPRVLVRWESIIDREHASVLFFRLGHVRMLRIAGHNVPKRHLMMIVDARQDSPQRCD